MKKRVVYWLCEDATHAHREKANALLAKGYQVRLFSTFQTLVNELKSKRASIIIVGDETSESQLREYMIQLSVRPELQGARFILSVSRFRPQLFRLAACCSFRDILPIDLKISAWLVRFLYATAGAAMDFDKPQPQIALNEISALYMPARIVWMDQQHIHLETRMRPEIGSIFTLGGDLTKELGASKLTLKAKERSKTNLVYRFSDGLTAEWQAPEKDQAQIRATLRSLKDNHYGPRQKIFLALQDTPLRQRLVRLLEPLDFALSIALKKSSIVYEPFYFAPDFIIIEENLIIDDGCKRYLEMVRKSPAHMSVLFIGKHETLQKLQQLDPTRSIHHVMKVDQTLPELIFKLQSEKLDSPANPPSPDRVYFDPHSPLSRGEIRFPARLRQVHPNTVTMDLPFAVGCYAIARFDTPLIKKYLHRTPTIKITNSYKRADEVTSPFKYRIEALLADIFQKEIHPLTTGLLDFVQTELRQKMTLTRTAIPPAPVILPPPPMTQSPVSEAPKSWESSMSLPQESVVANPIADLSINEVNFDLPYSDLQSIASHEDQTPSSPTDMEEERTTQMITQDIDQWAAQMITQSPLKLKAAEEDHEEFYPSSKLRRSTVHIEATDYTYERPQRDDHLSGWLGSIVGTRRNLSILGLLAFLSFVVAVVYFSKVYIERDWGKDQGKIFVDSLRGYAPKAFERGLPKKGEKNDSQPSPPSAPQSESEPSDL